MAGDAIFAGFVCGHLLALIAAPLIARLLLLSQDGAASRSVRLPDILVGLSPMMLAVPAFMFGVVLFSFLGLLFGMLFALLQSLSPVSAPGTPNIVYSGIVLSLVALGAIIATTLLRQMHGTALMLAASAGILFGWVLPFLALLKQ